MELKELNGKILTMNEFYLLRHSNNIKSISCGLNKDYPRNKDGLTRLLVTLKDNSTIYIFI
jgi:hypothetical protein